MGSRAAGTAAGRRSSAASGRRVSEADKPSSGTRSVNRVNERLTSSEIAAVAQPDTARDDARRGARNAMTAQRKVEFVIARRAQHAEAISSAAEIASSPSAPRNDRMTLTAAR